jgi:predicted nucleic-acid-binding protein
MKIALDTNVLVRMITGDNEDMLSKANHLVKKYGPREIFIPYGVILETYYVLRKVYEFPSDKALSAVADLLKIEQFSCEHEVAIHLALAKCAKGFSFNDALFGEIAGIRNVKTYTFDKGLKNNKNYEMI